MVPIPVSYLASVWSMKVYLSLLEATVVIVVIVMLKECLSKINFADV